MKILICPIEVSGNYSALCEGFRRLGVDCDFITYDGHMFKYGGESELPWLLKIARSVSIRSTNKHYGLSLVFKAAAEFLRCIWSVTILNQYDVFIFGFGRSLMRGALDLPVLRRMGKVIICNIGHGSEARPPYINGLYVDQNGPSKADIRNMYKTTSRIKLQLGKIERYATYVVGSPWSTSQFLRKPLINIFMLGKPALVSRDSCINCEGEMREGEGEVPQKITLLHIPSHARTKGTHVIEEIVERLIAKYENIIKIDYKHLSGVANSDVLSAIEECDILVDQLYSDIPMSSIGKEAALLGKPVIIAGYALPTCSQYISSEMMPPLHLCHPDEFEKGLEDLILNPELRRAIGKRSYDFVSTKWDCSEVARKYLNIIQENIPDTWWLEPTHVTYLEGCGLTSDAVRSNVKRLTREFGINSFGLEHRPDLENAFMRLIC